MASTTPPPMEDCPSEGSTLVAEPASPAPTFITGREGTSPRSSVAEVATIDTCATCSRPLPPGRSFLRCRRCCIERMRTNGVYIPYSMNATRGFLFGGSEPAPNFSRRTSSAYPIQQAMNQNGEQYNNGPGFVNDPDMNHTVGFHNGAGLYNESGFVNDQNINAGGIMQPYHADQNQPPQNEFSGSWQQDQSISRPFGFHAESHPPFVDLTRGIYPSTLPVIRIEGAPYNSNESEIKVWAAHNLFHFGNRERLDITLTIHIMMDRCTGKSLDVWIELPTPAVAQQIMYRVNNQQQNNQLFRINNRVVHIEESNQGELMKSIFPIAKDIHWDPVTGIPIFINQGRIGDDGEPVCGFRSFVCKEELHCCVNHLLFPSRAPHADKCPQRNFESMMATVRKFPWASHYYTVGERNRLFAAYLKMLRALVMKVYDRRYINANGQTIGLGVPLARAFVTAGLRCPGFSERQKAAIGRIVNSATEEQLGLSEFCAFWPFHCIGVPNEVSDEDLRDWMHLIDVGCKLNDQITEGTAPDGSPLIQLVRDVAGFWVIDDLQVDLETDNQNEKSCESCTWSADHTATYVEFAQAETIMMKRLISSAWNEFFRIRQISIDPVEFRDVSMETQVAKKMRSLGCFQAGGIAPPNISKPGDDIIHIPQENWGSWYPVMNTATGTYPVKTATEALSEVNIRVGPQTEAGHTTVQEVIRGALPLAALNMRHADAPADREVRAASKFGGSERPGHGSWHPDVATGRFNPYALRPSASGDSSTAYSEDEQEESPSGFNSTTTPHHGIQSAYDSGTWSAPPPRMGQYNWVTPKPSNNEGIDFMSIARQAVATKSTAYNNAPMASNNAYERSSRQASPQRDSFASSISDMSVQGGTFINVTDVAAPEAALANPFETPTRRQVSPKRSFFCNSFETTPRQSSPERRGVYVPPARRASPQRKTEVSPSRLRGRSSSPNKNSYTVVQQNNAWNNDLGAIGTPVRCNTVKTAPTIPEVVEEDWEGTSERGRGRNRFH